MKLNQNLIKQLRNGEIVAENNGTLEQLREVLKAAFPEDPVLIKGVSKYYESNRYTNGDWVGASSTTLPIISISDFYKPEPFTGWAKDDRFSAWMGYFKNDIPKFGFCSEGKWKKQLRSSMYSGCSSNRPATHEEIETTLTKEAKRRGYKGGDTIKGIHGTSHIRHEIISFTYDPEDDRLLTNEGCIVYKKGQWAEIIERTKRKPKPIHYLVDGMEYSFNYQDLKSKYQAVVNYSDDQFMNNLPEIAHLACIVSYFKGLGNNATIGDKGIIHELIHLMTEPKEPTNDLQEIREKFNELIQLV